MVADNVETTTDEKTKRRRQLADLRQHVLDEATSPSEKAMVLVALELSELRRLIEESLASPRQ